MDDDPYDGDQNAQEEEGDDNQNGQEEEGDGNQNAQEEEGDDNQNAEEEEGDVNQNAEEEEGDVNQNAQEGEGDDNQNPEVEVINRPEFHLLHFGVVREYDFWNRIIAHRVPINVAVAVTVLGKYLRWYEAIAGYDILSVSEAEGADDLLSTLTEQEWQRASPAPPDNYRDFVRVFATGPDNVEYELLLRHGVHEDEPPYYDLTHGWSRIVHNYGLREGDYVAGDGYRDVEGYRLRLELKFYRYYFIFPIVQEENQEEGEGEGEEEGEGEGGGSAAAAA